MVFDGLKFDCISQEVFASYLSYELFLEVLQNQQTGDDVSG